MLDLVKPTVVSDPNSTARPSSVDARASSSSLPVERRFSLTRTTYEWREVVVDFASGKRLRCRVPVAWSDNAAATLMSKYAVRAGVPDHMGGVDGREVDADRIFGRLVAGWRAAAIEHGYWTADDPNLAAFCDELHAMLEQQIAAPNSPQWFNTGVAVQYGIEAGSDGHYYATVDAGVATAHACTDSLAHPQISACFIQSVTDQLVGEGGIMSLWEREARLFKYGSGSGANYSALRGKGEELSRGGASSGLLSFLRVGDRSAGAIKSGGTTRRSARMVIVDVDHPDVEDFIAWKPREDAKIRALHAVGIGDPTSFEDEATETVSGQNANNSIAVTDDFMEAVQRDAEWTLTRRTDGKPAKTVRARDLWQRIAEAAHACADPGLQFADTINRWHTCPNDGPIRAANPCSLSADTLVPTEIGLLRIDAMAAMHARGEALPRAWCFEDGPRLRPCVRAWQSGEAKVLARVEMDVAHAPEWQSVECTPEHRFLLSFGDYKEAQDLVAGDVLQGIDGVHTVRSVKLFAAGDGTGVPVFDIEVESARNFAVTRKEGVPPVVVHNSEYVFLDDTACNLASINLAKLVDSSDVFSFPAYEHVIRLWTIVLDISVSMAGYPTAEIARRSMLYRTLGLGYAALGELLVMLGRGYGTAAGQAIAARLTETLTLVAYATSAELAERLGAFPRFTANREHVLTVLGQHANASDDPLTSERWTALLGRVRQHGLRNAQVTLLAPCGTIGIVLDCETTGVEPFYSDTTIKSLAGGGTMRLASKRFGEVLARSNYLPDDYTRRAWTVEQGRVREYVWIAPPPELADVLVCADDLAPTQHVDMMAAVQPFLSGAISKCVTGETLIATDRGIMPIADFYRGENPDEFRSEKLTLAAEQGQQQTADFYFGGERPVLRLQLGDGRTLCGTPNHRVKVGSADNYDWKRLDEIVPGDFVALRLGYETWASTEADLSNFTPSPMYGCQKHVQFPNAMTPKLARLLGYYIADGNMSAYSVRITKNDLPLLAEMNGLFVELFGVEGRVITDARNGVTSLLVNSKTLCEFFRWIGADGLAPTKTIPWAVLQSPKESILAFVRGLWLDGYVSVPGRIVAISLASRRLIEQLQVIFDNAGVRTVIGKRVNKENGRDYPCLYINGPAIQQFRSLIRLDQSYKQEALDQLSANPASAKVWSSIVPCYRERMRSMIRKEHATQDFRSVMDNRTHHVCRETAREIYERFGLDELAPIFDHGIHFVQVRSIEDDYAEVYDFHVPETHAFLGNSIVNHNTVNMPSTSTVDDVAAMYEYAWRKGLKSIAIYRDGCKPAQPLQGRKPAPDVQCFPTRELAETFLHATTQTGYSTLHRIVDDAGVPLPAVQPQRQAPSVMRRGDRVEPPTTARAVKHRVDLSGHTFYLILGEHDDGSLAEVFVTCSRTGSAISGWVNAWAKMFSLALQHGTPLDVLVSASTGETFDPGGYHDGRPTSSPVDCFARIIEARYLSTEGFARSTPIEVAEVQRAMQSFARESSEKATGGTCDACGSANLVRSGACFVCRACGTTTGCS